MEQKRNYPSNNLNKYNINIDNKLMQCRIYWARIVSSETESLFTQYTKHTFYELQYALEGRICMIVGDRQKVEMDESDFIVIPPDTCHQIVGGDTVGARFIMAFSVTFKSDRLKQCRKYLDEAVPHNGKGRMRDLFSLILAENSHDTFVRKHILQSLLECFVLKIIERVVPKQFRYDYEDETGEMTGRVAEICSFIHDYNGIGIRVFDVAARFSITERHLNRILRAKTGKSPREIINYEKLKKLEDLVATTSLSLNEISELCGFSDEYAMNKFFRRYSKTSLSDFRNIKRKK